jgi:hypothetical protein
MGNDVYKIQFNNNILRRDVGNGAFIFLGTSEPLDSFDFNFNVYGIENFIEFSTISSLYFSSIYTLSEWRDYSGFETSSFISIPNYTSFEDLHLNNDFLMNGTGILLPEVFEDIDGESRNLTSLDIGADEFDIDYNSFNDLAILSLIYPENNSCGLLNNITIELKNNSTYPILSFDLEWKMFDTIKERKTFNLEIKPNATVQIKLEDFNFLENTDYEFYFSVSQPNGSLDNNLSNNELFVDYSFLSTLEIYKEIDECNNEYTLYVKGITNDSIEWSTGEYSNYIKVSEPGTYSVSITNNIGCTITKSITIN